jgi:hypothetical protein
MKSFIRTGESGAALAEFAICLPVFAALFLGAVYLSDRGWEMATAQVRAWSGKGPLSDSLYERFVGEKADRVRFVRDFEGKLDSGGIVVADFSIQADVIFFNGLGTDPLSCPAGAKLVFRTSDATGYESGDHTILVRKLSETCAVRVVSGGLAGHQVEAF